MMKEELAGAIGRVEEVMDRLEGIGMELTDDLRELQTAFVKLGTIKDQIEVIARQPQSSPPPPEGLPSDERPPASKQENSPGDDTPVCDECQENTAKTEEGGE